MIPSVDTISRELCEYLRSSIIAEGVSFDEDSSLSALGIDSFSIIEILLFIERRFNIVVPESDLTQENLKSAASLARSVHLAASGGKH